MRIITLTSVAAFALMTAACNSNSGDNASAEVNMVEDTAANEALGANSTEAAMPTDATGFANAVAASDLYEIESAKLAAAKAGSGEIKAFAVHLRTDHEKSSTDLKAAAAKATPPLTVTPVLDAEKQTMLDELKATDGADFDRRFIDQQTNAHQKALALLRNYVGKGESQPLKDFASKAIKVVEGHLEHLNSIRK